MTRAGPLGAQAASAMPIFVQSQLALLAGEVMAIGRTFAKSIAARPRIATAPVCLPFDDWAVDSAKCSLIICHPERAERKRGDEGSTRSDFSRPLSHFNYDRFNPAPGLGPSSQD